MKLYSTLDRVPLLRKSYILKFFFIAFLGIHIPLLGMIAYLVFVGVPVSALSLFIILLVLTLAATMLTLLVLSSLLSPIVQSYKALKSFKGQAGDEIFLPSYHQDEAGCLMKSINNLSRRIIDSVAEKEDATALLSHDMRSPSSSIILLAQSLKADEKDEERLMMLDAILKLGEGQLRMLSAVLDLLKLNEQSIELESLSIRELVMQAIGGVAAKFEQKEIKLELVVP